LDTSESKSEIPGKFGNMVPNCDGKRSVGPTIQGMIKCYKQLRGEEYPTNQKKKDG
jgi:hypothetical protein